MNNSDPKTFLFISTHDYRSPRKANVHFITRELSKRGQSRFFSMGFSFLSLIKKDPRASLWPVANQVENCAGVECYLWRTIIHPVNLHRNQLARIERLAFMVYRCMAPRVLKRWTREANTIIVESGMGVAFVKLLARINPAATIIYLCSDALETVGCSTFLRSELNHVCRDFSWICVPSIKLKREFADSSRVYLVPHGIDEIGRETKSPFVGGVNVVSVGSMLFDPDFFEVAAKAFPEFTFHIIGGGKRAETLSEKNIVRYGELAFESTIPFLQHADVGVAAYRGSEVAPYLVDTSMKLMQYGVLGIPAVCPEVAAGHVLGRFGYTPGDARSIRNAIDAALKFGRFKGPAPFNWSEVTDRILDPESFRDTATTFSEMIDRSASNPSA